MGRGGEGWGGVGRGGEGWEGVRVGGGLVGGKGGRMFREDPNGLKQPAM